MIPSRPFPRSELVISDAERKARETAEVLLASLNAAHAVDAELGEMKRNSMSSSRAPRSPCGVGNE